MKRIEPLQYRVIRTDRTAVANTVRRAIETKPAPFFQSVRHLLCDLDSSSSSLPEEEIYALLRLCTCLSSLYILSDHPKPALLPILQEIPQLREFTGSLKILFSRSVATFNPPLFCTVTHMNILEEVGIAMSACLAAMPALTHLCLFADVLEPILEFLFGNCKRLHVLINLWPSTRPGAARMMTLDPPVKDARLVITVFDDSAGDWEAGANGGRDLWADADAFLAYKHSKQIACTSPTSLFSLEV
jgi:hypothetical protein